MLMLGSTIRHSDVIVNVASTMTIDAATLDKPVVCVAFEKDDTGSHTDHLRAIFYHSHYRKLVDTKAFRLVFSEGELAGAINAYLEDPTLDASGREQLRRELCYRLDGQSAQRAALMVLREAGASVPAASEDEKTVADSAPNLGPVSQ
jgi:CDP-glycerol glycerophosphotransferase (TagB/SpsB family)